MGRMGAQVVSGIGFLGAGTILVTSRKHVKGLTSAAGIWASACMGLAIGIGFYEAAVVMCLILFIILSALERFDEIYIKRSREISVYLEYDASKPLSMVIQGIKAVSYTHLDVYKRQGFGSKVRRERTGGFGSHI